MADPQTTNKGLFVPPNNADINAWDVPVNSNSHALDTLAGGVTTLNATGLVGLQVLTPAQYAPANLIVTGSPAGLITYQLPGTGPNGATPGPGGFFFVANQTNQAIQFGSQTAGTVAVVPAGTNATIVIDPNNGGRLSYTIPQPAAGSNGQVQYNNNGAFGANGNINTDGSGNLWLAQGLYASLVDVANIYGQSGNGIYVRNGIATPDLAVSATSGTIQLDARTSNVFKVGPLTGPITYFNVLNALAGQTVNVFFQQGPGGNATITWPGGGSWYFPGGNPTPQLTLSGYAIDLLVATYMSNWGVWAGSLITNFVSH